jgi:hypothetical protein
MVHPVLTELILVAYCPAIVPDITAQMPVHETASFCCYCAQQDTFWFLDHVKALLQHYDPELPWYISDR